MTGGKHHAEIEELSGYTPEELYSEIFYRNRKVQNVDLQKYDRHCNNIYAFKHKNHMIYLCKIVLQYLEQSAQWKENENQNEYDECILLNYWLYDELYKEFFHDKSYINIAYGNIQTKWANLVNDRHETSYHNKCKPLFNKILKYDDWKKGKELYDYCINYKYIEQMCQFQYEKCGEYCEYVEKRSYLYDHFEKACTANEGYCPHFYNKCKSYNPNTVLKTLKCPEKVKTPRDAVPEASVTHHHAGQEQESGPGAIGSETSDIGTKVGHSVLGVAPVLLTATALYRYTPIGSWIRNLSGNTTNNISGMDGGEMEGFFPSSHESGGMLFGDTQNYISYQPM
ncbi:PIR Superfamily Protein [Plasmodium ovale wallikeri]|uniref:PIR Superfamily Protein n=2 Tax=Plasmodium ovale TaxID=36330 RepID=A0A1A9AK41_PLAOA|nr:PIR Superfamily Protein [Plasmodium ovale wallikeri]SBT56557.1 PIR Superfamily Protein [Plasmodium ovale wallikeri]SBT73863.1 PIR protein [Plasmodium ovale]